MTVREHHEAGGDGGLQRGEPNLCGGDFVSKKWSLRESRGGSRSSVVTSVGERAVDIVQTAAIDTGILGRAAAISARALGRDSGETRFAEWM
jgi:hypothetical protein